MTISGRSAIISGIGISPIGRRTGIAGIDLTASAAEEALTDAGLTPSDIDGITTMGDTPLREASARLGVDAGWHGGGFDTGGFRCPRDHKSGTLLAASACSLASLPERRREFHARLMPPWTR